ncbi:MAG: asnB, partial [Acidobacteria bacterium]|nr:asnB [Acidobacteriota bacterium]
MCGIAGFASLSGGRPAPGRLDRMIGTLRHRGPDDHGLFTDGVAALAAARLSIIDVAGGHQPISIDGGAITVVQNGEIYNYVELRAELERAGRHFATACDTEVIAHLYAAEGIDGFRKMRGMFAVAVWDEPRQRLILGRDRFGKKPLHWWQGSRSFGFGSEIKAILAHPDVTADLDVDAHPGYLRFGYVP